MLCELNWLVGKEEPSSTASSRASSREGARAATDETSAAADINQYGDYNGLTGYSGLFFPSWTDRRGGGPEEIWTASIMPDSVTDYVLTTMI